MPVVQLIVGGSIDSLLVMDETEEGPYECYLLEPGLDAEPIYMERGDADLWGLAARAIQAIRYSESYAAQS